MKNGARATLLAVSAGLVLSPFLLLSIAWAYERILISSALLRLHSVATALHTAPTEEWKAIALKERVWIRVLEADNHISFDSHTALESQSFFWLGNLFEAVFELFGGGSPVEPLPFVDAQAGDWNERGELKLARENGTADASRSSTSGHTVIMTSALKHNETAVLLVTSGSNRGLRQLLLARNQLVKLVGLQLFLGLFSAVLLGRRLVSPLERLAKGARAFPAQAIADEALLARADELGALARAFNELTLNLESRRQATVRLAGDLAHEVKNPLATIEAAAELMATTRDTSEQKRTQIYQTIHQAVERLRSTTETLVAEVRLETALTQAPREKVHYGKWLQTLLDNYGSEPQHVDWTLELHNREPTLEVALVVDAWERLLRNLLDNARVQPSATRVIRVVVHIENGQLHTDVTDFGPGVSEGNRDKLFRRFFTSRPAGSVPGMGLGLSIVESVAAAHGGTVSLQPSVPNEGATFRVSIPAATP